MAQNPNKSGQNESTRSRPYWTDIYQNALARVVDGGAGATEKQASAIANNASGKLRKNQ